tara:strand:+ start:29605 stop:30144 length:540 start_codon:yes stop_codon:yes gene_type:complete
MKINFFFVFNFIGLQLVWAACAYGAVEQDASLGVIAAIIYLALHFSFSPHASVDFIILVGVTSIGLLLDSLNQTFEVVSFYASNASFLAIPYWLLTLWMVFAVSLPHSLYWLHRKPLIAMLAGAFGSISSYYAGSRFDALSFAEPLWQSLLVFSLEWALLLPLSYYFIKRLKDSNTSRS